MKKHFNIRRFATILFLTIVLSQTAYSWDNLTKDNPNYKGILSPKCEIIEVDFICKKYPWIFSDSIHRISVFDNYLIYKLDIPNDGIYHLTEFDDDMVTNLFVLTKDSTYSANELPSREQLKSLDLNLQKGQDCLLVLLKDAPTTKKIKLTFCLNQTTNLTKIKTIPLNNIIGKQLKLFSSNSDIIGHKKFDIYNITEEFSKNGWSKIQVNSKDFTPILYGFNKDFAIITEDSSLITSKSASISFNRNDSIKYIAIGAYFSDKIKYENSTTFTYTISCQTYPYNPSSSLIDMFNYYLKNSLISFIAGILITVLISIVFYYLSLRKKKINFEEITDKEILFENPDDENATVININNEKLYKCCIYEFSFTNTGHLRIDGTYVKVPLKVQLVNLNRIIDIKIKKTGDGWLDPIKNSDNELTIQFNYIDVDDKIEIKIIGEIDDDYKKNHGIQFNVSGKIAEVAIRNKKRELVFITIYYLINIFSLLLLLPLGFTLVFKTSFPRWFDSVITYYYPFAIFFIIVYTVSNRNMRQQFINTLKAIIFLIKKIIK
jgi:hypothetical protein